MPLIGRGAVVVGIFSAAAAQQHALLTLRWRTHPTHPCHCHTFTPHTFTPPHRTPPRTPTVTCTATHTLHAPRNAPTTPLPTTFYRAYVYLPAARAHTTLAHTTCDLLPFNVCAQSVTPHTYTTGGRIGRMPISVNVKKVSKAHICCPPAHRNDPTLILLLLLL